MAKDRPKMCANCGKLMGVGTECPYCGADNRSVKVRLKRAAAQQTGGGALTVTNAIVVVNLFLFGVVLLVGGMSPGGGLEILSPNISVVFRLGLLESAAVDAGQWWRLVMPVFLHLGLLHVAFNCFILYIAGRWIEAEFGSRLMFLVYIASGVLGFVASYFFAMGGAGASGAVAGLLGALLVRRRLVDGHFKHPITQWVVQLVVLNAVIGLVFSSHINNIAHLGGFITGGLLSLLLTRVRLSRRGAVGLMLLTWGFGALTLLSFALMTLSLFRGGPNEYEAAGNCFDRVRQTLEPPFQPDRAEKAVACLDEVATLEAPANDARDAAEAALKAAIAGYNGGDSAAVVRGQEEAGLAWQAYKIWEQEAAPRYGYRVIVPPAARRQAPAPP